MARKPCGRACIALSVRLANFVVMLVGCGLIAYGAYLATKFSSSYALYGSLLGLGVLDAAFGLVVLSCGYSNLFFLRLYGLVLGLLEIAQASIAVLFMVCIRVYDAAATVACVTSRGLLPRTEMIHSPPPHRRRRRASCAPAFQVPDTRQRIIDAANLPADLRTLLEDNLSIAGPVLIGVVGFQALTLLLMSLQCAVIDRIDLDADEEEAVSTSLLGSSRGEHGYGKAARSGSGGNKDRFAALEDEGLATAAASKYQSKNSAYYEKYGVRRN